MLSNTHTPTTFREFMQIAASTDKTVMVVYDRDLAVTVLTKLNEGNRRKKDANIEQLADSMKAGQFKPDIQRIFISGMNDNGECRLFNGQHTLEAVAKANVAVPIETRFGAPEEYLKYIDVGASRSVADIGRIAFNMPYAAANAGCYRAFKSLTEKWDMTSRRANAEDVQRFWLDHQATLTELHHSLSGTNCNSVFTDEKGRPMKKICVGVSNSSVKSALLLASLHHPVETRRYLEAFLCEEGRYWAGDVGPALAKRKLTGRDDVKYGVNSGLGRIRGRGIQHIMLKTLHMFVKGETATRLVLGNEAELTRYVNFFLQRPLEAELPARRIA